MGWRPVTHDIPASRPVRLSHLMSVSSVVVILSPLYEPDRASPGVPQARGNGERERDRRRDKEVTDMKYLPILVQPSLDGYPPNVINLVSSGHSSGVSCPSFPTADSSHPAPLRSARLVPYVTRLTATRVTVRLSPFTSLPAARAYGESRKGTAERRVTEGGIRLVTSGLENDSAPTLVLWVLCCQPSPFTSPPYGSTVPLLLSSVTFWFPPPSSLLSDVPQARMERVRSVERSGHTGADFK